MVTADILNTHSLKTLRSEISKTNIKGYSKMKKAEVVELMLKNKDRFMHIQKKGKKEKSEPEKEQKSEPEKKPKLKLKQKSEPEKKPKLKLKQKSEPEKKQKLKLNGELVMIGKRGFVVKGDKVFHKKSGKAVSAEVKANVMKYLSDPVFKKKIDAKNK